MRQLLVAAICTDVAVVEKVEEAVKERREGWLIERNGKKSKRVLKKKMLFVFRHRTMLFFCFIFYLVRFVAPLLVARLRLFNFSSLLLASYWRRCWSLG